MARRRSGAGEIVARSRERRGKDESRESGQRRDLETKKRGSETDATNLDHRLDELVLFQPGLNHLDRQSHLFLLADMDPPHALVSALRRRRLVAAEPESWEPDLLAATSIEGGTKNPPHVTSREWLGGRGKDKGRVEEGEVGRREGEDVDLGETLRRRGKDKENPW